MADLLEKPKRALHYDSSLAHGAKIMQFNGFDVRCDILSRWYLPSEDDAGSSDDIIKVAYQEALHFHKGHFSFHSELTWLLQATSVDDVLGVLAEAQARHGQKKTKSWKPLAVATSWWKVASERMMHYERVIDTFVSTNPEYAGLVWGAMKFLFTVTLNYEQLSSKIAQCFAEIGSVLPEAEFIAQRLYPVKHIRTTLANVYAQIIEFCIRATRWYDRAQKNFVKKAIHTALSSWPLEFEDIKLNIDMHIRRLREQSTLAHQVETRDMHSKISDILQILQAHQTHNLQRAFDSETMMPTVHPSLRETLPFIRERVVTYLCSSEFDPDQVIESAISMRYRRRTRGYVPPPIWASEKLREWITTPTSAVIQLKTSIRSGAQSRDIALDMIELLRSSGLPVIWYIRSPSDTGSGSSRASVVDVLRSLIRQLIDQHTEVASNWRINETDFHTCQTEKDWLRLLVAVIGMVPQVALVLDTQYDAPIMQSMVDKFWEDMQKQNINSVVKIFTLTSNGSSEIFPLLPESSINSHGMIRSRFGSSSLPNRRMKTAQARMSGPGSKTNALAAVKGLEDFKSRVSELVASNGATS